MKIVISILLFSLTSAAAPVAVSGDDKVEIAVKETDVKISVPAEARKALIQWRPEFLVFDLKDYSDSVKSLVKEIDPQGVPMAFVADLNNDGTQDIALMGSDLHNQYAVALVKEGGVWQAVELQSFKIPNIKKTVTKNENKTPETGVPLYVLPAQDEHAAKLGKKIGVQVEHYMGPARVYEIKDGKAAQVKLK
ncbi:hypothetical protein [Bdellovibrio sp. HCB274]|uniref:hypothetical protein n=1 Tax=Bdellovibrio sp. HCB274 TaxID=3394361 RepID=UPI0039B58B72